VTSLHHGRVEIVLHELKTGAGSARDDAVPPLLLLHELGGRSEDWLGREAWRDAWRTWPGPVHALDFAGHGHSAHVVGGAYSPEYFLADADQALAALGDRAALVGVGLGAWVALLLAGARSERVPAALLWPGPGLAGGGSLPDFDAGPVGATDFEERCEQALRRYAPGTDLAVCHCEVDLRPVDYARCFAERAPHLLFSAVASAGGPAPDWWLAAREVAGAEEVGASPLLALARLRIHCR